MAWQYNRSGGLYKKGASSTVQKRCQILADFLGNGNMTLTAQKNSCSYNHVSNLVGKYFNTGTCQPGNRGKPPKKMDAWKVAYIEVLVVVNPFVYLEEIQNAMRRDLNLVNAEIPSIPVICRTLKDLDLTRHKATKVAAERFTQLNMARRIAFFQWRATVNPARVFFLDETAFQRGDDIRTIGRCHTNDALPLVDTKNDNREKMSVLAVIGYNNGVLGVYPQHGSFNRVSFNYGFSQFLLPLIPPGSFVVMDNASIHNERDLVNLFAPLNMTLVKLPTYSYDLNPIEMVNGLAKIYCKRSEGLLRQNMPFAIVNAFSQVSVQAVQGFYRKSWQIFV